MRKFILLFTILALSLPFSWEIHGEAKRFSALKAQSNTPYSNINDIFADSYGIMWLATENGLIQYNGYDYTKCEQDTSAKVHYNNFRKIFEDSRQRLWVCTDKGLAIYDRPIRRFKHIDLNICDSYINGIAEDKAGHIWVLTRYGLIELDEHCQIQKNHDLPCTGNCMEMGEDQLWIGSWQEGLYRFDLNSNKAEKINLPLQKGNGPHVQYLLQASNGQLFIGTRTEGLLIYNPRNGELTTYSSENTPNLFVSNFVAKLFEDSHNNIWIGFVNGKLLNYDTKRNQFSSDRIIFPTTVDKLTINSITEDSRKNIWIGTHHYWLFFSGNTANSFDYFKHSNEQPNTVSNNAVTSFIENNGEILIGTDGGGINKQKPHVNHFISAKQFGNIILDIKEGKDGDLWIASWGNSNIGVTQYNRTTGKTKVYSHNDNENSLPTNNIHNLLVEGDSVWMATDGAGVCLINAKTGAVTSKHNTTKGICSEENPQWASHIMRDYKNRLWICTSDGVVCHQEGEKLVHKKNQENGTLDQNESRMTFCDSKQRIWLITTTGGLNLFDEESKTFSCVGNQYHIPNTLNAITEDNHRNLWITATNEVILFNPDNNMVRHFDMAGDLGGYSFAANAIYKSENGEIYVGSNNGFFAFNPEDIINKGQYEPSVYLRDLYINGEKVKAGENSVLRQSLNFTDTIRLTHDQNHFGIEYFGIDYGQTDNLTYYYAMEGLSPQWIFINKETRASFTNFSAGTYTFLVKVCEMNGDICSTSKPLTIIIDPAWWQTWWFKIICLLTVFGLFNLIIKLREKQLKQRQEVLEKLVAQRTDELRSKNEKIEQQNKQLDETLNLKDRIMSIIAHDLRNPITAIVGNLSLLTNPNRAYNSEEQGKKVQQTFKSAKKLQDQMENLLEWARIQNNSILFSPADYFLGSLTKESVTLLQNLLDEKKIDITIENNTKFSAYIDQRMVSSIIRNLLNNAIKFTPKEGKIAIRIDEDDNGIVWSISDNGVGMDETQVKKLTEENHLESTFGTNNEKGSGLGLMICHDFITKNKGTWEIQSRQGEGTTFTLHFPKGALYQKEDVAEDSETITYHETNECGNKSYKLLIVDDNDEIRSYLKELFADSYEVLTANNGKLALNIATQEIPDIIISDVVMPEMDGKTFCHAIKSEALTQHIPLILLTTEASVDSQIDGINYGADDYVTKPFNEQILRAKVSTLLKNKELQRDHFRKNILAMPKLELPESQDNAFLRKINETICENIAESDLSVEFLAEKTALSRVQLFRKFKAITGCTPSEYIKAIRLQHAADILESGKHSISDVAYMVGFSDPKYFSNCFSEKFGMTPSQYAKK